MRYIGIDYGTKRIGVALSDESGTLAFAHSVIESADAARSIGSLAQKEGVSMVVLGESLDLNNKRNPLMVKIDRFKGELEALGLSVIFEPEGMTSAQAARNPMGEHMRTSSEKGRPRQANVDASAAALILQSFLDKNK